MRVSKHRMIQCEIGSSRFPCKEELVIDGHCSSSEAATSKALDEACYPAILLQQTDHHPKIHMRRFAICHGTTAAGTTHCWSSHLVPLGRWSFGAKKRKIFSSRTPREGREGIVVLYTLRYLGHSDLSTLATQICVSFHFA